MARHHQPHAFRTGECARCVDPLPPGHDRYCPRCLVGEVVACQSRGCRTRLPRRADGAAQTCPGCAGAVPFELDLTPVP